MKEKLLFVIMMISILCFASAQQEIFKAADLSKAASANPEAVKAQYVDQTIKITGTVARTYTSRYMTSNIELVSDKVKVTFVLPYSGLNRGRSQLSDFKPGQTVTMEGRVVAVSNEIFLLKEARVVE